MSLLLSIENRLAQRHFNAKSQQKTQVATIPVENETGFVVVQSLEDILVPVPSPIARGLTVFGQAQLLKQV